MHFASGVLDETHTVSPRFEPSSTLLHLPVTPCSDSLNGGLFGAAASELPRGDGQGHKRAFIRLDLVKKAEVQPKSSVYCTLSSTKGRCSHNRSGFACPSRPVPRRTSACPLCVYKLGWGSKGTDRRLAALGVNARTKNGDRVIIRPGILSPICPEPDLRASHRTRTFPANRHHLARPARPRLPVRAGGHQPIR
jgi:hypothetical protein